MKKGRSAVFAVETWRLFQKPTALVLRRPEGARRTIQAPRAASQTPLDLWTTPKNVAHRVHRRNSNSSRRRKWLKVSTMYPVQSVNDQSGCTGTPDGVWPAARTRLDCTIVTANYVGAHLLSTPNPAFSHLPRFGEGETREDPQRIWSMTFETGGPGSRAALGGARQHNKSRRSGSFLIFC